MHSFRKDRRGVSNAIVFVLGLVIVTVIVANVFLWNFEMNQLDWEKMQENVSIVNVTSIMETWSYNSSGYALGGSTSKVSGSVSDLTSDDGVYMTFRSYYSGTDTSDFVDQTCDLYPPSAKGTHSNFLAQQAGPDSIYDTLTETNVGSGGNWGITLSSFIFTSTHATYRYMGGTSPNTNDMIVTKLHIRCGTTGTVAIALYTGGTLSDPRGATKRTEAYNVPVSSGWNTIDVPDYSWPANTITWIGWCHSASVYYSTSSSDSGDFQSGRGRWDQTSPFNADETSPMPTNPGAGSFDNYWYAMYAEYTVLDWQLDLEVQWTSVDYNEANEKLCIYAGNLDSEDLRVDYWSGSTWSNLLTDLTANSWNNVSISLSSSTFTIRFKGGTETGDTTLSTWNIDVTLLHVWSNQYSTEVEFIGSSNTEEWTQLNWTIDSSWTIGSVDVTLQLYNYTLNNYSTSGNGYMSYTSATANTDETKRQTITVNPTHFRNATGYWKIKVKGVKVTDTQFDFKADWVEFKAVKAGGTLFTFENKGSLTCHLVSLWIINSTVHQHYDIDVFINSGDTYSYVRYDINLPNEQFTVKVVTERGNTKVYSVD